MSGFVYAIGQGFEQPVKIGVASDVARRLTTIQAGNPADLRVLWSVEHPEPFALEAHLHRTFAAAKVRGEWFKLDDVHALIAAVAEFEAAVRVRRAVDAETQACVLAVGWMVDNRASRLGGSVEQAIVDLVKDHKLKKQLLWSFRYRPPVRAYIDQYIPIARALWAEAGLPAFDWKTELPHANEIIALVDIMKAKALTTSTGANAPTET